MSTIKELKEKSMMEASKIMENISNRANEKINEKINDEKYEDEKDLIRLIKKEISKAVSDTDILELQKVVYNSILASIGLKEIIIDTDSEKNKKNELNKDKLIEETKKFIDKIKNEKNAKKVEDFKKNFSNISDEELKEFSNLAKFILTDLKENERYDLEKSFDLLLKEFFD